MIDENFIVSENLTKVNGQHTFKMGWEMTRQRENSVGLDTPSGTYDFSGMTTLPFSTGNNAIGNGFASFLLGAVASAQYTQNRAAWLPRWWQQALYFQDSFKPTKDITLNLGLRWSYESPFNTKYGQQSQFDPTVKDPLTGLMGAITHPTGPLAKRDLNNFQPRVGLAWRFAKNWSFRGSFGVSTLDLLSNDSNVAFEEYTASANIQQVSGDPRAAFRLSQGPGVIPYKVNADGTVPFIGTNLSQRQATLYDPNMRMPYIMSWGASIQYQLSNSWLLETSYQGTAGVGLLNYWNINAIPLNVSTDPALLTSIANAPQNYLPYKQFGQIRNYSNYGHSTYHGGTVRMEKRYSRGITFNAFYTYAKALDEVDTESAATGVDFYNRRLEKGVAGFDVTNRFVDTFLIDLPFGRGRRFMNSGGVIDKIFGGWQLTWSDTLQSGRVFGVSFTGGPNKYLPGLLRPDIVVPTMDDALVHPWDIGPNRFPNTEENKYLNVAAFAYPAAFHAGTLGRNTFRGPMLFWSQTSLAKEIPLKERLKFTMKMNISNVFNRPEFSSPLSVYDTANLKPFGTYTSTVGAFAGIGGPLNIFMIFRLDF